jgi:hypothetical protein
MSSASSVSAVVCVAGMSDRKIKYVAPALAAGRRQ